MQRKKLLALPINTADRVPAMQYIEKYKNPCGYVGQRRNYCYTAFVDSSTGEDVLIIDLYKPAPNAELVFRLFQTEKKWFSLYPNGKTGERSLFWELGYWNKNSFTPFDADTDGIISDYIKYNTEYGYSIKGSGIWQVRDLQDKVRQNRLKNKYDRIKESVSREMLEIHKPPKAFENWIVNTVMKEERYLFYDSNGKAKTKAICSHCGAEAEIKRPHQEDKVKCPHCHSLCVCKAKKQFESTYGFKAKKRAAYVQPLKDGSFCTRYFTVQWVFSFRHYNSYSPEKYLDEETRCFQDIAPAGVCNTKIFEKVCGYEGGDWKERWDEPPEFRTAYIFPGTLNKIFKNADGFNKFHFDYELTAKKCGPLSLKGLWKKSNEVEFLMNLVNNGLTKLAQSIINAETNYFTTEEKLKNFDLTKGSLRKGCGIGKDELPFWQKVNPDITDFIRLKKTIKTQAVKDADTVAELIKIADRSSYVTAFDVYEKVLKYSTPYQFLKYYKKQKVKIKSKSAKWYDPNPESDWFTDYKDYLGYAQALEYNLREKSVLFPERLKEKHDELYKIVTDEKFSRGELPQIAQQYEEYSKLYTFEDENFIIRPPVRHKEVSWEGELLHHCVATYAKRIAEGETIILFIRKKEEPDEPYFTLNLDPVTYKIIQCRGLRNCSYPLKVGNFIKKWYAEKVKPLKGEVKCQKTA